MSIRYECDQCGSVLKIKVDLAGKPGKCPKCKTPFTVPAADESEASNEVASAESSEDAESHLAESRPADSSGDFDVDAFLSSDEDSSVKSTPKAAKGSRPTKEIDATLSLDEPEETSKSKRSKSGTSAEISAEDFQIRRGPDAPGKSAPTSMPGLDNESGEQPAPSRRPPGTNPNAPAANIASDLLSKSAKKGKKAKWDEVEPEKKEEPGFDWDGLLYEARTKLLPVLGGGAAVLLLVYFLVAPMFGGKGFVPKLGTVTGTISVNGKPLAGVTVWFHPEQKKQESKGKSFHVSGSVGQTDATGHYELMYDPKDRLRGVVIGKCRVEIMALDYSGISEKYYSSKSEPAKVEVNPGNQVINLDLSQ